MLIDILNNYSISLFSNNCFDEYLSKISNIDVDNIALYPMSTIGKKALYNAMFIGLFPNDSTVEKKKEELRNIYKM